MPLSKLLYSVENHECVCVEFFIPKGGMNPNLEKQRDTSLFSTNPSDCITLGEFFHN